MNQSPQQTKRISPPENFLAPVVGDLYSALNQNGARTRFVGGCVRDAVLGQHAADLDLATTLPPEESTRALEKSGFRVEPTGVEHGTVMAIKGGKSFEVTTLRRDVATDGRHAEVAFSESFREDAARRDFTFNALYMDNTGHITDFFGGLRDLEKGYVRFVGDPAQRLQEDWLRALRYVRFYGRFGQQPPDAETFSALKAAAPALPNLSAERITTEVLKTVVTPKAPQALMLMADLDYFNALALGSFSVDRFATYIAAFPATRDPLTLLLAGFWWKEQKGEQTESPLLTTPHLRFSKKQLKFVKAMAPENLQKLDVDNIPLSCWRLGPEQAAQLWRYESVFGETSAQNAQSAAKIAAQTTIPPFPLKGADLAALGYEKGPEMGRALKKAEKWWAENGFPQREKCLLWVKNNTP